MMMIVAGTFWYYFYFIVVSKKYAPVKHKQERVRSRVSSLMKSLILDVSGEL